MRGIGATLCPGGGELANSPRHRLIWRVAATYIGTVVGAGFASGQEALRFFVAHGRVGLAGVILASAFLGAFGVVILALGERLQARSQREVLRFACGPWLAPLADGLVSALLLVGLAVMLAGGGAIVQEHWGLPNWTGVAAIAALTLVTLLGGMRGLVIANAGVVPVLVVGTGGVCAAAILHHGLALNWQAMHVPAITASSSWVLSACLFAAYNLVLSIGVLAPLGHAVGDRRAFYAGGLVGAAGLGLLLLGMYLALATHMPGAEVYQVPMLYLAQSHGPLVKLLYSVVLWAEVYTTAVASAFALARRLADLTGSPDHERPAAVIAVLTALGGARLGFAGLVATLYPVFGYASSVLILLLARATWRNGFHSRV